MNTPNVIASLDDDMGPEGDAGSLSAQCVPGPEVLKANGYRTYISGKRAGRDMRIANARSLMPGCEDTCQSYGQAWAKRSNTPFRLYKYWTHGGGISGQLPDVMATILQVTGCRYRQTRNTLPIPACEDESRVASLATDAVSQAPLLWGHEDSAAMCDGWWRLVRNYPNDWAGLAKAR